MPGAGYLLSCNIRKQKGLRNARLRVVPYFSSGIVERAKRERAWKSPHARRVAFSRGLIFTRAHVSLVLLCLRKNGGLLVGYRNALVKAMLWFMPLLSQSREGWISSSLIARKPRDRRRDWWGAWGHSRGELERRRWFWAISGNGSVLLLYLGGGRANLDPSTVVHSFSRLYLDLKRWTERKSLGRLWLNLSLMHFRAQIACYK